MSTSATPRGLIATRHKAILAVLALSVCPLNAADTQPNFAEEVVELPKIVVSDSRLLPAPERWHYARIPGFEVISTASKTNTKRFLHDFLLLQDAIAVVWPAINQQSSKMPTHLILCGGDNNLRDLTPVGRADDSEYQGAVFLQDKELFTIVVSLIPTEFTIGNDQYVSDPYRAFYAEYFRFLVRRGMGAKAPAWFEEGLVQILGTINFDKKTVELGKLDHSVQDSGLIDTSSMSTAGDADPSSPTTKQVVGGFAGYLRNHALLGFEDFFLRKPKAGEDTIGWRAQSFGFVHMCLFGRQKRFQKAFLTFVEQSCKTTPTEESFKKCFGKTYDSMMIELRGYVDMADHEYVEMRAKKGQSLPEPPPVDVREASDSESGRIKGAALRLGGHLTEAKNHLIAPYIRGERDPELLAALGLSELALNETARARKFLEAAVKGKTISVRACVELSRLRMQEALVGGKKLSDTQLESVLAPLNHALTQAVPLPDTYELFCQAWLAADAKPAKQQLMPLVHGMNFYPRRGNYLYNCARLYASAGLVNEARAIIDMGMNNIPTPEARKAFTELLASLPPAKTDKPSSGK